MTTNELLPIHSWAARLVGGEGAIMSEEDLLDQLSDLNGECLNLKSKMEALERHLALAREGLNKIAYDEDCESYYEHCTCVEKAKSTLSKLGD